jgi:hypothetical protein
MEAPAMSTFLRGLAGLLGGVGLLWLLLRGTDATELIAAVRLVDLGFLCLGQILLWASFLTRAQRWSYIVRAVHPASFRSLFSATQIGVLVNFTVPGRLGELVRATVLSRLAGIPVARSLAMAALDRVSDVIGLLVVVLLAVLPLTGGVRVALPAGTFGNAEPLVVSSALVQSAAWALAGATVAASVALVVLYVARDRALQVVRKALAAFSPGVAERAATLLGQFAEGLHVFRSRADLSRSLFWSLLTWAVDVASVAAILAAFGVAFPWHAPFLVLSLVSLSIAVPITPGMVGQFHLPAVAGLLLAIPALPPTQAKAIAIVDHLSTLVPIAALGVWCLLRERLGLLQLLRQVVADTHGRGNRADAAQSQNPPPTL